MTQLPREIPSPASFVVRIDAPEIGGSVGLTGFLVSSQYVMTCAHVAVPADELREPISPERIQELPQVGVRIQFEDGSQATGEVVEYAVPDCALIRLDQPLHRLPVRLFANLRSEHEPSILRRHPFVGGFPASPPDELMRSPVGPSVSSLAGTDLFDFQIEGGLPRGMSGGPALVEISGEWFCIGMAYLGREGAATSRLVSSQTLLAFAKRNNVDCLPPAEAEDYFRVCKTGIASRADEERLRFLNYVTFAGRFAASEEPISLPDVYVHRTAQEEKIKNLIARENGMSKSVWLSVQGNAGSGKSSLLWWVDQNLSQAEGIVVQPFAAQYLSADFEEEKAIVSYLAETWPTRKCVVLIDTLDLIVGRGDRELASFIAGLQASGASVVTTCRPLEAQRLLQLLEPGHIVPLGRYSEAESRTAVSNYVDRAYPELTSVQREIQGRELWNILDGRRRVQELSFEPLLLRMIFEAYPPDPIPAEINTALIYSTYWQKCVVRDRLRVPTPETERERETFACRLADTILFRDESSFSDAIRLSEFEVAWRGLGDHGLFPHHILESLQSSGAIESTAIGTIRFFHQTLLEFAAARSILRAPRGLRQQRLDRIVSDLKKGVFFRAPVLVQVAVQDAQAGGDTWIEALNRLAELGSDSACYMTLEILGKVPENAPTARVVEESGIVVRWTSQHLERLAECAIDTVSHYPRPKIAFGLTILEPILHTGVTKEVFALSERLASIDQAAVLEFLKRTLPFVVDPKLADDDARGHYKSALLACADAGEPDAIRVLGAVLSHLNEGQQQGSLQGIAERVNANNCDAVGDFLQSVEKVLWKSTVKQIIEDYLAVLTELHRISPDSAASIAKDLLHRNALPRIDHRAWLTGCIEGVIAKTEETIPRAIDGVLSPDHQRRLTSAATLAFSNPSEQSVIVERFLSLDLPQLSDSVRGSLFSVVAELNDIAPERVIEFISHCPWPENAAGKAWRKISARLANVAPGAFKIWLLERLKEPRLSGITAVGFNQLLLSGSALVADSEIRQVFAAVLKSDIHCRGDFAETIGAIAATNRKLASEIFREFVRPRHRDVWASLGFSLNHALQLDVMWVSENVPLLIAAATSRRDEGAFAKLLEGLRDWPERQRLELTSLLEESFTLDVLKVFPQEKCQVEYLLLVKIVSRAAPNRAFELLKRAVIDTDGTAGAAASVAANIVARTDNESIMKNLMEQLLFVAPKGRQPVTRNAIYHGLRSIDEKLGHRFVIRRFFEIYKTIEDPDSLKPLIRTVNDLSSWTQADTARLLEDLEHIKGPVRSFVMKLKRS